MRSLSSFLDATRMAQHRAGELGEETLDEIKPGAVLGREDEFEAAGGLLGSQALVSLEMCAE